MRTGLVVAACLLLGACGSEASPPPPAAGGTTVTPAATGEPTSRPTGQPTNQPTGGPSPGATEIEDLPVPSAPGKGPFTTLRGTVSPGVEAGCLLLTTDRGVFQLLGPARAQLRPGMTVEVDGAPDDQLLTTCQQGTPFLVAAVRTT